MKSVEGKAFIDRKELLPLLDRSRSYALTMLLAPAGSGKSTLLNQWRRHRQNWKLAYLPLSRRDIDPVHFFNRLDTAIRSVAPRFDGLSYNDLSAEAALPAEVLAEWLAEALQQVPEPFYILLDDFQLADNPLIHDVIAGVLMQMPEHVHWILATRNHPRFSLSRLKLEDRLLVIDRHDLRFSKEECDEISAKLCPSLDPHERHKLWQVTEGWAAGIKLGLLAGGQPGQSVDAALSGNQPELVDYFARVVLHDLPDEVKELLLVCSVLDRFSAPLCNDLLARDDSEVIIDQMRSRELFLRPIDDKPGWWRMHALFQEFLQGRAQLNPDVDTAFILRRASDWFMRNDDEDMALQMAMQEGDTAFIRDQLALSCERWIRKGNYSGIVKWVLPIAEDTIITDTDISGPLIAALILTRRFNQAQYFIDLYKETPKALLRGKYTDEDNIAFQETMLQLFQHDTDFRVGADREALLSGAKHNDLRAFSLAILAYHFLLHAEFDEALVYAQKARDTLEQLGYHYLVSYADLILVLCDRNRGRMMQATQYVHRMYERYADGQQGPAWVNAATAKAVVLYEMNGLTEARALCETLLPLVSGACATEVIAHAYLTLIRILDLEGEATRSQRLLNHLERILQLGNYDRFRAQVVHERMRQAFRAGDASRMDELMSEYRLHHRYLEGEWHAPRAYDESWERLGLAVALWLQHRDRLDAAERVLQSIWQTLQNQGANARSVVAQAHLVVIAWHTDRRTLATERLQILMLRHGIECLNRTALDEAPGLHSIMETLIDSGEIEVPPVYRMMFRDFSRPVAAAPPVRPAQQPVNLTSRERDVLTLLCRGISNREIGEQSGLAITTIKWHIKNIFSKLNVSSRAEAIVMATQSPERFGLMPGDV